MMWICFMICERSKRLTAAMRAVTKTWPVPQKAGEHKSCVSIEMWTYLYLVCLGNSCAMFDANLVFRKKERRKNRWTTAWVCVCACVLHKCGAYFNAICFLPSTHMFAIAFRFLSLSLSSRILNNTMEHRHSKSIYTTRSPFRMQTNSSRIQQSGWCVLLYVFFSRPFHFVCYFRFHVSCSQCHSEPLWPSLSKTELRWRAFSEGMDRVRENEREIVRERDKKTASNKPKTNKHR